MIDYKPLTNISKEIRAWIEQFRNYSIERKEESKTAITAISNAIIETQAYIKNGVELRDTEKESELTELWNQAHIELRNIDKDLANRCFMKARYWSDPSKWNQRQINYYKLTLNSISGSLKEI